MARTAAASGTRHANQRAGRPAPPRLPWARPPGLPGWSAPPPSPFSGPTGVLPPARSGAPGAAWYWKAYRTAHGTLQRVYLGKSADLTLDRLNAAAAALAAALAPRPRAAATRRRGGDPAAPLLATKLFVPPARAKLVPRPRLFARLQAGLRDKLTLIAAPAGFGKTTLLSAWRATAAGSARAPGLGLARSGG